QCPMLSSYYPTATPPSPPPFPYTTLFRSTFNSPTADYTYRDTGTYTITLQVISYLDCGDTAVLADTVKVHIRAIADFDYLLNTRSEEHTSELQSRRDVVCRLLLAIKKHYK